METREFLIPDYYLDFHCKGGACRQSCCLGWKVTISLHDYFKLLGTDCSPELRRKLDTALHVLPERDEDRYAEIAHDWEGRCPMWRQDGLCMLHAECGEEMLSSTCRYHPRSIRTAFDDECCCSCSCEAVVELLLHREEPLRMIRQPLAFDLPLARSMDEQKASEACAIRDMMIGVMQDRHYELAQRLTLAGRMIAAMEDAQRHHAADTLQAAQSVMAAFEPAKGECGNALPEALRLTQKLLGDYDALADICQKASKLVGCDQVRWDTASAHFDTLLPHAEHFFEHVLVNHLFFLGYPFSARHETLWDEHLAIVAAYVTLRYTLTGAMADCADENRLVDACAACFRILEHANFGQRAVSLLRDDGITPEQLERLAAM